MGSLSLDYNLNGFSFSQTSLNVSCFVQNTGTTELISAPISFDGESVILFVDVDNNGTNEELSLSVFKPTDSNDDLEINLNFLDSESEIEGENSGNTTAEYFENSNRSVHLSASVIDDNVSTNTAEFELELSL